MSIIAKHIGKLVKAVPAKSTLNQRVTEIRNAQHAHFEAIKVARTMRSEFEQARIHASIVVSQAKQDLYDARIDMLAAKLEVMKSKRAVRQAKRM